jgi:hypothetical protein
MLGHFLCDIYNFDDFCQSTTVIGGSSAEHWLGIAVFRCHAPTVRKASATKNRIGIIVSEGATNALVEDNYVGENSIMGIVVDNTGAPNPNYPFTDPFAEPPINATISKNYVIGSPVPGIQLLVPANDPGDNIVYP